MQSSIAKANEFIHFVETRDQPAPQSVEATNEADLAAQNDASLVELQQMIKGIM